MFSFLQYSESIKGEVQSSKKVIEEQNFVKVYLNLFEYRDYYGFILNLFCLSCQLLKNMWTYLKQCRNYNIYINH